MMFCEKCNIEFPEGLRYCKWCGQTLVERQRVTSELYSCPACSAAAQPSWAFCKACGAKLGPPETEPASAICPRCNAKTEPGALNCVHCGEDLTRGGQSERLAADASTSLIVQCPSCGDPVEAGAMYCKGCGSAVYTAPEPFGQSSLLCRVCNSYSPVGSAACRVCGASLIEPQRGPDEGAPRTLSDVEEQPSTLPDLSDHIGSTTQPNPPGGTVEMASIPPVPPGAADETRIFSTPAQARSGEPAPERINTDAIGTEAAGRAVVNREAVGPEATSAETISFDEPQKKSPETSVLPGVAGSKHDSQAPTTAIHARITEPVEADSGELAGERAEDRPPSASPVTKVSTPIDPALFNQNATDADRTVSLGSRADLREGQWQPPSQQGSGTVMMGSVSPTAKRGEQAEGDEGGRTQAMAGPEPAPPHAYPDTTAPFALDQLPGQTRAGVDYTPAPPSHQNAAEAHEAKATRDISIPQTGGLAEPVTGRADWEQAALAATRTGAPAAVAPAPPAGRKSIAGILSAVVVLIVLGVAIFVAWWFLAGGRRDARQTTETATQTQPATPPAETTAPAPTPTPQPSTPLAPAGMVYVAGGTYIIGRDESDPLEGPQHTVEIRPFFIDRTEVTNADYKRFVDATGRKPPEGWQDGAYPAGADNLPVVGVTWQDAADYAAWAGKRLPTEAEWEAAARGPEGRLYPWGNDWRAGVANISTRGVTDVGKYADSASPSGALDMIGNVWEWTADEFSLYPGSKGNTPPSIEAGVTYRIFRGGAYDGNRSHTAAYRGFLDASKPYPKVGFRCAKDAR
jgi:formylglycine-generating enzyme required for sulfatase activity/DNA-directed RNA polymerase subunit M/transcription elongation factor TFIIS